MQTVAAEMRDYKSKDLAGQRFGRLTAIRMTGRSRDGNLWECHCDCGKRTVSISCNLLRGATRSCGCLANETRAATARRVGTKHGMAHTSEWSIWAGMRDRCDNPKATAFDHYGGRGITVCDRWRGKDGFKNFYADMGPKPTPKHSIDRIDVNGDYEPSNCRWATHKEQCNNTRRQRKS